MELSVTHCRNFEIVRDMVQEYTGWDFKKVHRWFHEGCAWLPDKPLSMVMNEESEVLKEKVECAIEEGVEFAVQEIVSRPASPW